MIDVEIVVLPSEVNLPYVVKIVDDNVRRFKLKVALRDVLVEDAGTVMSAVRKESMLVCDGIDVCAVVWPDEEIVKNSEG